MTIQIIFLKRRKKGPRAGMHGWKLWEGRGPDAEGPLHAAPAPALHRQSRERRGLSDYPHHGRAETKEMQRLRSHDLGRPGRRSWGRHQGREQQGHEPGTPCRQEAVSWASADAHGEGDGDATKARGLHGSWVTPLQWPQGCVPSVRGMRLPPTDSRQGETWGPSGLPLHSPGTQPCPCSLPGERWGS